MNDGHVYRDSVHGQLVSVHGEEGPELDCGAQPAIRRVVSEASAKGIFDNMIPLKYLLKQSRLSCVQ